ncbi:universal stress protein [Fulvimonas soli]|jgi:nucleotide-binding universal stress UspA family protein|uniref:Nucleotide-binding universal stress UspA family protein n=1 Tax=Fulvimonas soli TaxID=155197 RepID=A0A316IHD8_9GAMM|nr:universal stress protein [Fulvimonas soli]PWK89654.1 nucleotide-binding universal stress UspA family protein [Fulvimonas soli]TNY27691.1 universal stress protein UspA [Fulvimonas soli]
MFKHILLPTDGSDLSLRAVDTGIGLAAQLGAKVYAFHVVAPFPTVAYLAEMIQATQEFYTDEATRRAQRCLDEVRQRAEAAKVACTGGFEFDQRPYTAIIGAATRQGCDLIVMASHGWRGFDRLLLGSETHKVLLNTQIPVLVCH